MPFRADRWYHASQSFVEPPGILLKCRFCFSQSGWMFRVCLFFFLLFSKSFFFNWSIIALQCCVSFYCTTKWISCMYTYILSPHPTRLGHHRAPSGAPCVSQRDPASWLSYTWQCVRVRAALPTLCLLVLSLCLCLCFCSRSRFVCAKLCQSCLTLCDCVDFRPAGSSVWRDSSGKNAGVGWPSLL